jgi:peptidoglycan/xylan/chitin deacetylase (PgdA/CDA1 family)
LKKSLPIILAAIFSIGCGGLTFIAPPVPTAIIEPTQTLSPLPSQTETVTATQTFIPTETPTVSPSQTFADTPTLTPEPQWYLQGPGEIVVPILLYHHIDQSPSGNFYYLSPIEFEKQMYLLREWGYTTIPVELLVRAIKEGAVLPPKPIILTFDDGTISTYTHALPIMQKYNFTGTSYIVYNYIGTDNNYMDLDQIRALAAAGWEIGSHSLSHMELIKNPDRERDEIVESRKKLQSLLDVPILSFAYPFGVSDRSSVDYARFAGYIAAVGLGNQSLQSDRNLFYLYRMEVNRNMDIAAYASLLPWREDMNNLPALTLIP